MKALSIRQPWASLIVSYGKDIENRNWRTNIRGKILIHASKRRDPQTEMAAIAAAKRILGFSPIFGDAPMGGIIGTVDIVDCVSDSDSPWFVGKFGFVLENPQGFPLIPYKGKLGFFDISTEKLNALHSQN
jgi:hypothetical protein